MPIAKIESLDFEGHGVARVDGKTIFIDGALPFETVTYSSYRKKPNFENAQATEIHTESFMRTEPACPHFGVCGGCSIQHMEFSAQVAAKQRVLEDNLQRIGNVKAEAMLPAIYGPEWGYRHRARLSARNVAKKGTVLVGFHEKRSSFIADMTECKVMPASISEQLPHLRKLVGQLSIFDRMPQIELAMGENVTVLVFRNMEAINAADEKLFKEYADRWNVQIWLQPKGPDTAYPLYPLDAPALTYVLPEFGIEMPFKPTEFTQVNHAVNRVMVERAIKMLDPQPGEVIADMFCGLGNFTLPIARRGAKVLGMEGSKQLVERAFEGARHNKLDHMTDFAVANLFEMTEEWLDRLGRFDKMLIDPPRDGAIDLVKAISAEHGPKRIVYVSCSPSTLARDANVLVNVKGYTLKSAGVINMFPHTAHVESIAWFEKTGPGLTKAEVAEMEAAELALREAVKAEQKAAAAAATQAKAAKEAALQAERDAKRAEKQVEKEARRARYLAEQAAAGNPVDDTGA
ncbi:23S rRNA (uracil1939-C5)-methyltransferase [Andreprevotia lacus DSM 23236]|jgi:23S rRNA (uracil1939-C5)-methyltransferase|uniref:23S rRNA (uracil(1939)-C(5))-methyltransferase RlmD n=1 Tax=Andreprevotia lacus DSM 23236 TaxID=1121001 RepID=A0A1W1X6N2_9NEIS|nr:23S rRNA (uracil(1939)-C(5))-methyltransferase RlmD [Andreprevotia lacus]SMC19504.1 23S rRNA (uracil1939-C5)-methyltransferase [Andreprevotia lacus DSM 23236]